ncbi:hypothetical protein P152DRAFT_506288 [Eremomyces bilateralis CBS 781.70]|uniref:Peptide N-acetyl-beta-D-glucosaminyl asparaginase amidase A N-terminal domain-containing protein n=1 Tax=Eremomyces bilateralis CBS 781.70 TaxID=1392243 RepID=A0A6G1G8L1_9PEZI|nr:uncharacterized protein P152DRAFT_506288 [Eremomyces bilateralis CBS 781.70]KAF1814407.1 hypothetical protein P152DRAFT_506288 [Eremomyces bilateralis CBS 781.70]
MMRYMPGFVQQFLSATWLLCFQVNPPMVLPGECDCTAVLMTHTFAFSYGHPFVGIYQPPDCEYNAVAFNLTVTSAGRQFDRLGAAYFGNTEIFRTSTAEPTQAGILWTYMKDMTPYLSLFKQPQTLTFDLGNLVDETYTGTFNTTLAAIFYNRANVDPPADVIIPVSGKGATWKNPGSLHADDFNVTSSLTLPRNIKKAIFSISAVGQMEEEFWWANTLDSNTGTFPDVGRLYGSSPFRELQLQIDGVLAGVSSPFPIIFTGGIAPGFWRPIVGIDAFDLQEDEIDITPWLGTLCDGQPHDFGLKVIGISDDGNGTATITDKLGSYWVLSGKIFLWLDVEGSITTGMSPRIFQRSPQMSVSSKLGKDSNGTNTTLDYHVEVHRYISSAATISTSEGERIASWEQSLHFSTTGNFSDHGCAQITKQISWGYEKSSNGYSRSFSYPLWVDSDYHVDQGSGSLTIQAKLDRTKHVSISGHGIFSNGARSLVPEASKEVMGYGNFPRTVLYSRQNGSASYRSDPAESRSFSNGATEHQLRFTAETLYERHVLAVNGSIVFDYGHIHEGDLDSISDAHEKRWASSEDGLFFAGRSPQRLLGRGPSDP